MIDTNVQKEVQLMWETMRADGDMIADTSDCRLGMPFALAYEVIVPLERDGEFLPISLDPESLSRLLEGLHKAQEECVELTSAADAKYDALEAAQQAAGGM